MEVCVYDWTLCGWTMVRCVVCRIPAGRCEDPHKGGSKIVGPGASQQLPACGRPASVCRSAPARPTRRPKKIRQKPTPRTHVARKSFMGSPSMLLYTSRENGESLMKLISAVRLRQHAVVVVRSFRRNATSSARSAVHCLCPLPSARWTEWRAMLCASGAYLGRLRCVSG